MILVLSTIVGIILSIIIEIVCDIPIILTLFVIVPSTMALGLVVWLGIFNFAEEEVVKTNIYTPIPIDGYKHYWKDGQVYYYDESWYGEFKTGYYLYETNGDVIKVIVKEQISDEQIKYYLNLLEF